MIDLHVHLSGSLKLETIISYAKERNISLPTYDIKELEAYLQDTGSESKIESFYKLCRMTDWVLKERRTLRRAMKELVQELDEQGIIYAEIRIAPAESAIGNLRQKDVIDAALEGMEWGMKESKNIRTNLILCIIPDMDVHEIYETIVEAKQRLHKGVCGLDLLMKEDLCKTDYYDWMFEIIRDEHIPFTVHSGQYNVQSVRKAIQYGAERISQSIHILDDDELLDEIIRKKILVEICPASNLKLGVVESYSQHPIRKLYDKGVRVCLGSDRLRISGSSLRNEYDNLKKYLGFTDVDIYHMNQNAINGAFLSRMDKDRLQFKLYELNKEIVDKEQ